ncbi:hypothetical protein BDZ85DRAFT_245958 [Elsinoe ampelina]|uniref:Uncharacterized protein n=1 Tax=Elsinoe ampelina TaxID=302913 RepID=A0A6A6GPH8_9PEZI|nr:hypothetical protein BDZ85DRAFT_245958 [Elsinoe ampelina]
MLRLFRNTIQLIRVNLPSVKRERTTSLGEEDTNALLKVIKVDTISYLILRKNIYVYNLRKPSAGKDKNCYVNYYIIFAIKDSFDLDAAITKHITTLISSTYEIFLYLTSSIASIKDLLDFIRTKATIEENLEVFLTPKKLRFIDINTNKKRKGD